MSKKGHSEEQIVTALQQAEVGDIKKRISKLRLAEKFGARHHHDAHTANRAGPRGERLRTGSLPKACYGYHDQPRCGEPPQERFKSVRRLRFQRTGTRTVFAVAFSIETTTFCMPAAILAGTPTLIW